MSSKPLKKPKQKQSFLQTIRSGAKPVRQLLPYLKPYRGRFFIGLLLGGAFGVVSGLLPLVLKQVMTLVQTGKRQAPVAIHAPAIPGLAAPAATVPVATPEVVATPAAIVEIPAEASASVTPVPEPVVVAATPAKPSPFSRFRAYLAGKLKNNPLLAGVHDGPGINSAILLCSMIPVIMILRGALGYFSSYFMAWVSLRVLTDLRDDVFQHVMRQSLDFFHKNKSGDLISRVYNDPRMAQMALSTVSSDLVTQPIAIVTAVAVLLILDWKFTLISLCLFPLCLLPVIIYGKRVRRTGGAEEDSASGMMVILQESFAGIRIIKSLAREPQQIKEFEESNEVQFKQSLSLRQSVEAVGPLVEGVSAIGAGLTIFYVWYSGISASTFMGMLAGLFMLYDPVKKLSRIHITMQRTFGATSKIFEILGTEPTVKNSPTATAITSCVGRLTFEDVHFIYRKDRKDNKALQNISFDFDAGKYYALVGASGAGKSTMLALILRFYDPTHGSIFLDGRNLRDITQHSLREQIGVVTQETFLFHDTIANNIRYGRMDATDEEVHEAARLAFAHDFIIEQPKKYDTVVGDKGCNISGGQQQRLAIARALLKNAPILLLDEATSALDSESELMIQSALELLSSGRTVIAIAHRLSTILKADKILVMDRGQIVESGTHEELLASSVIYRRLYNIQFHHSEQPAEMALVD